MSTSSGPSPISSPSSPTTFPSPPDATSRGTTGNVQDFGSDYGLTAALVKGESGRGGGWYSIMSEVAADYYRDPEGPGFERYWNGVAWTGVRRPHPFSGNRSRKGSWFGGLSNRDRRAQPGADVEHADLEQARTEIRRLRQQLTDLGGFELGELRRLRDQLVDEVADQQQRLDALHAEIVTTQDEQILQEIGIYDYLHPLTDAVAYREALRVLQGEIKAMARRDGGAIEASLSWHVNGSLTEDRKAIREYSKLMLRAYNEEAAELRGRLDAIEEAIERVDFRAANIRAGYVYVISNVGAFGDKIVKIGLTRRLEPMDRIRELSNASVPFKFDVHALFFAMDAVSIEAEMHRRLADRRVNRVNARRKFFYATPAEAREHLEELTGQLLRFDELAEAVEYRQSAAVARGEDPASEELA
ncbi:GIY-YIG nuclease family protein [Nocardia salmonicida]|uniref:GIY-YIG nuclease family protein n=1 Tax=Nocardia salmonicida TaxID=53431 RepID=UPI00369A6CFA